MTHHKQPKCRCCEWRKATWSGLCEDCATELSRLFFLQLGMMRADEHMEALQAVLHE